MAATRATSCSTHTGPERPMRCAPWPRSVATTSPSATRTPISSTDLPMLEAVGHPIAVNPDSSLRATALERDWPIRDFARPVDMSRTIERKQAVAAGAGVALGAAALGLAWYAPSSRPARLIERRRRTSRSTSEDLPPHRTSEPARTLLCRHEPFPPPVSRTATGPLLEPQTRAERWREQSTPIPTRRVARPESRRARCPPRRGQTLLERAVTRSPSSANRPAASRASGGAPRLIESSTASESVRGRPSPSAGVRSRAATACRCASTCNGARDHVST